METISLQQIIELLPRLSMTGLIGLALVVMWRGGIFDALASWIRKNPESSVAREFKEFKELAEGNHYTDLQSLLEWRRNLEAWKSNTESRLTELSNDVSWIRGRMGNGHK